MTDKKLFYPALLIIVAASLAIRALLIDVPPFQSDESINVYASYAIAEGAVPYRDIVLSHPPVGYLIYSAIIRLFGNSIEIIRTFVSVLYSVSLLVEAILAKEIVNETKNEHVAARTGIIAAFLSAVYPGALAFTVTAYLEVILLSFALSGLFLVVLAVRKGRMYLMMASGVPLGLAVFTKFVAVLSLVPLILLFLIPGINLGMSRKKAILSFAVGLTALSLSILSIVAGAWGAFDKFLDQAVLYQIHLRPPFSLQDRFETVKWYTDAFSLLLVLAIPGALALISRFKKGMLMLPLLPVWLYLLPLMLQFLTIGFWFHHLVYLTPLLCLMGALSIGGRKLLFPRRNWAKNKKKIAFVVLLLAVIVYYAAVAFSNPHRVSPYIYSFDPSPYTVVERSLGSKIEEMTSTTDKIWTSEGAIAFFASRLIVTPATDGWPVSGFFDYWLGQTIDGRNGTGLVTPSDFETSWKREQPRVLIFIRKGGWVPYPDELLWQGYDGVGGVRGYVTENYGLYDVVHADKNPYDYEIWLRKE